MDTWSLRFQKLGPEDIVLIWFGIYFDFSNKNYAV